MPCSATRRHEENRGKVMFEAGENRAVYFRPTPQNRVGPNGSILKPATSRDSG